LKCFFEEGRALARITHPNVVSVLNFFRANETVYMVMAYESGRSLQDHILRRRDKGEKPLVSERFICKMFGQVMNGLREVHANKLLHLDLKPALGAGGPPPEDGEDDIGAVEDGCAPGLFQIALLPRRERVV